MGTRARDQVTKLRALAQDAHEELRSLVFQLRPPDLDRDGLCGALRKHVELVQRLEQREIGLELADGLPRRPERDGEVLRIAQEALQNALRHSGAEHIAVAARRGPAGARVIDDGRTDPSAPCPGTATR
jgi:signal transduction histidine kinase